VPRPDGIYSPAAPERPRYGLALLLFVLTFGTATTLGPVMVVLSQAGATTDLVPFLLPQVVVAEWSDPRLLGQGLAFALSALTILLAHEMGHYVACRRYGLASTLPYFLPVPLNFGTFGAFIRIKAPFRTRRELFDVGIAGPIAGFAALIPFLLYGVAHSRFAPLPAAGDLYELGHPLALQLAARWFHGPTPAGSQLDLHPVAAGAWLGLFATALNLLPLAQLDGGHLVYALFGRLQKRLAPLFLLLLGGLGFLWQGWWLWCGLVLVLGLRHPPVYEETEPLDGRRRALAWLALLLLVLSFSPVPIAVLRLGGARSEVGDQGHGAVVHQRHPHGGAEAAGLDPEAAKAEPRHQRLEQRLRLLRRRGAVERRPAPAGERPGEGELRDQEELAPHRGKVEVHLARLVLEDPQAGQLLFGRPHLGQAVPPLDPDQRQEPPADPADLLGPDPDRRFRNSL